MVAAAVTGYEPWQKTLIGASAGALSLVTIAGNLMVGTVKLLSLKQEIPRIGCVIPQLNLQHLHICIHI